MILLLLLLWIAPAHAEPRSGYADAGPVSRAMQDDDTENPAFFAIEDGRTIWAAQCASCHGQVATLRGVATHYPKYDPMLARPVTLAQRINAHPNRGKLDPDSPDMLALTALIGLQSRGMKLDIDISGPARSAYEAGKTLFFQRQGQLNLACATCHNDLAGHRLGGAVIPEGHPNGYPIYRLDWQSVGSLERRLRQCVAGVRAAPFAPDGPELAALEFYLAARATGLTVETPAVRP